MIQAVDVDGTEPWPDGPERQEHQALPKPPGGETGFTKSARRLPLPDPHHSPDDIRVFTKTGADWTSKCAGLVEAARELEVENAIIDGEAVVTNAAGLPDFGALQTAVHSDPYAMCISAPSTSCT
jgi:bifunctional non-homologous end joining protein LigD